jgi:hypothetical protein
MSSLGGEIGRPDVSSDRRLTFEGRVDGRDGPFGTAEILSSVFEKLGSPLRAH